MSIDSENVRRLVATTVILACFGDATVKSAVAAPAAQADTAAQSSIEDLKSLYKQAVDVPYPESNPYSADKVQLGQVLFFDPGLSADRTVSCGTCHIPDVAWRDGLARGAGHDGKPLPRHTPTILDLAWEPLVTWDGRMDSLEQQALDPIRNPQIGGEPIPDLVARLQADEVYPLKFAAVFGDAAITPNRIAAAIATFERSVVSDKSPFDRWIEGDEVAIGEEAKRGFVVFNGDAAKCSTCHMGWRLTDDGFHDIGLPNDVDLGRGAKVPSEPLLLHAFKTPTLRGVSVSGPYMHDGSVATLDAVLTHYSSGVVQRASTDPDARNFTLSSNDRSDLLAFLDTLSAKGSRP